MSIQRHILLYLLLTLGLAAPSLALPAPADSAAPRRWSADWIRCPNAPRQSFGVYYFRKAFTLDAVPEHFVIHASADNRYELFLNGARILAGPAAGDVDHWRYETLDLAGSLHAGRNVLAAVVWNFAELAPMVQQTLETGFLLHGEGSAAALVDTGDSWKVLHDRAFQIESLDCSPYYITVYPCYPPPPRPAKHFQQFYTAAEPNEIIDGAQYPWGWEKPDYDDSTWPQAIPIIYGGPREINDTHSRWQLEESRIPQMEASLKRLEHVRRFTGPADFHPTDAFLAGQAPVTIPAHSQATILLDQSYETTAYPELVTSGGRGSQVTAIYAEALFDEHHDKGNRNEIEGKHIEGYNDKFLPDGGSHRLFRPLWWRDYRYVELDISTADEPLTLDDYRGQFTAYPFTLQAKFESGDPTLQKMWEVGWRGLRICAHDIYLDPYYEHLQYVEDTRIESMESIYLAGDDRLEKNALEQFRQGQKAEGLTLERYPAYLPQYYLGFSLYWLDWVHDYWWYRNDPEFVRSLLPNMRAELAWFKAHLNADGLLMGPLPYSRNVESIQFSLEYVEALHNVADMEAALGSEYEARQDRALAGRVAAAAYKLCWVPARHMLATTGDHQHFDQYLNAMGVLSDVIPRAEQARAMQQAIRDPSVTHCELVTYYHFFRALKKAGLGDEYLSLLQPWMDELALGLSTFPEHYKNSREDCIAWSAHPVFDFLSTVAGVEPGSAGFQTVAIEPHLGTLKSLRASMPHQKGNITVDYKLDGTALTANITLPPGLKGTFTWKGQARQLHPGAQELKF